MRSIPQKFWPLPPTSTTTTAYPGQNMVKLGLSLATPPSILIAQNHKSKLFSPVDIPRTTLAMALNIAPPKLATEVEIINHVTKLPDDAIHTVTVINMFS